MNLMEILEEKNLIFIAISKKIYSVQVDTKALFRQVSILKNQRSLKLIFEGEEIINQIKILKDEMRKEYYLILVDMKGFLHKININENNKVEKFDCRNEENNDNSCWSLDGKIPYIAAGGNHHKIKIHNFNKNEEKEKGKNDQESPQPENEILTISYNKHNVPCVAFSPCGNFLISSSIDKHARIIDFYSGKLIKEFLSEHEWGWCVKMCAKTSLNSKMIKKNDVIEPPSFLDLQTLISLFPEAALHQDLEPNDLSEEVKPENEGFFENEYIKSTLGKYCLFHTTQYCLYLWDPVKDIHTKQKTKNNYLGKINLLRNYLKTVFTPDSNPNYASIYQAKYYIANSRYDNIFVCERVGILVVSNRAGDVQIYNLCLDLMYV